MTPTPSNYENLRDAYLVHVEACKPCGRNKYGKDGWTLDHWTILHPCSAAQGFLAKLEVLF